jgi:TetR/AcrR family transcriptional repressor of nem operon
MQRAQRGTQTRQKLLETASRLMSKQGYTATRVEQICNEAGVTKGAFFHYFKTKDDLGKQTVEHFNDVVREEWIESGDWRDEEDPTRRLFGHLAYVRDRLADRDPSQGCVYCVVSQEAGSRDPEINALVRDGLNKWRDEVATMIKDASNGRELKQPAEKLADCFLMAVEGGHMMAKAREDAEERRASMEHFRSYLAFNLGLEQPPV